MSRDRPARSTGGVSANPPRSLQRSRPRTVVSIVSGHAFRQPLLAFDTGSPVVSMALALPDRVDTLATPQGRSSRELDRDDRRTPGAAPDLEVAGPSGESRLPGVRAASPACGSGWPPRSVCTRPPACVAGRRVHFRRVLASHYAGSAASAPAPVGPGGRRRAPGPLVHPAHAAGRRRCGPGRRVRMRSGSRADLERSARPSRRPRSIRPGGAGRRGRRRRSSHPTMLRIGCGTSEFPWDLSRRWRNLSTCVRPRPARPSWYARRQAPRKASPRLRREARTE